MTKAIRIHANGGPEVLRWEDHEVPPPAAGEARIRHTAIGINYSDVNVRHGGFYIARPPQFPLIIGNEAAGVVASVGTGRHRRAAGRPRRLCGHERGVLRTDRRLRGGAQRSGRAPAPAAGWRHRPAGRRHDGQGLHRLAHHQSRLPAEARRHDPDPRGRERRRAHSDAMVEASRRDRDRHGRIEREGADRAGARLRPHHSLSRDRFRRRGESNRAARRLGGVRRRRQGHLHGVAALRAAVRDAGQLRQRVRPSAAARPAAARQEAARSRSAARR